MKDIVFFALADTTPMTKEQYEEYLKEVEDGIDW